MRNSFHSRYLASGLSLHVALSRDTANQTSKWDESLYRSEWKTIGESCDCQTASWWSIYQRYANGPHGALLFAKQSAQIHFQPKYRLIVPKPKATATSCVVARLSTEND